MNNTRIIEKVLEEIPLEQHAFMICESLEIAKTKKNLRFLTKLLKGIVNNRVSLAFKKQNEDIRQMIEKPIEKKIKEMEWTVAYKGGPKLIDYHDVLEIVKKGFKPLKEGK